MTQSSCEQLTTPEALRRLAAARDPDAWALLLERYGPWLLTLARRFSRDEALAEDIVQETLLHLRDHAESFRGNDDAAARAWIARITCNVAISLLRSRDRQQEREWIHGARKPIMTPEKQTEWTEILERELLKLPESLRRPVLLRYYAGLDCREAAAELNLSESALKNRVSRGLERLRQQMAFAGVPLSVAALGQRLAAPPPGAGAPRALPAEQLKHWQSLLNSPRQAGAAGDEGTWTTGRIRAGLTGAILALLALIFFIGTFKAQPVPAIRPSQPPAVVAVAAPPPAPKPEVRDDSARIAALLEKLCGNDETSAHEAEDDLLRIGAPAKPALNNFAVHASPSPIGQRAIARVLRKIDADEELALMVQQRAHRREYALKLGGSEQTEADVDSALAWLAKHQQADGHWDADPKSEHKYDIAATSLALLAFLGAGNGEDSGPYAKAVERGVRWLIDQQTPTGAFVVPPKGIYGYEQPMAAHAVAEAAVTSHRPATVEAARLALREAAVNQSSKGAWRYAPLNPSSPSADGDLSITSWYAQFLHIARGGELGADDDLLERTQNYLYSCFVSEEGFNYSGGGGHASASCTAMGSVSTKFLRGAATVVGQGVAALARLNQQPGISGPGESKSKSTPVPLYTAFFETMCLFQDGGPAWVQWNSALIDNLHHLQLRSGDEIGSWDPVDHLAPTGRAGTTAAAAMCLEVYYRYPRINK